MVMTVPVETLETRDTFFGYAGLRKSFLGVLQGLARVLLALSSGL